MLLILGAVLLGAAAFVVAEARTLPARQRRALVKRAATYGAGPAPGARAPEVRERPFAPAVTWLASVALRFMPRTSRSTVTLYLLRAGLANRISADELIAAKALSAVLGVALGILVGIALGGVMGFVVAVAFGALGFVLPGMFVNSRISDRRDRIQAALPDALDLLAVTVEAGLGFDGALAKLVENSEGPLAEEFALALNEMRIGEGRMDALKKLATRVDVPEVGAFVRAVVQADQLGMSMATMLRVQAADARIRRQLAAEEKAAKAPVKMLIPLIVLLLPAMFIVILGPFFLNIDQYF